MSSLCSISNADSRKSSGDFAEMRDLLFEKIREIKEKSYAPTTTEAEDLENALWAERKRAEAAEMVASQTLSKYEAARKALSAAMAGWSDANGPRNLLESELEATLSLHESSKANEAALQEQIDRSQTQLKIVQQQLEMADKQIAKLTQHNKQLMQTSLEHASMTGSMRKQVEANALVVLKPALQSLLASVQECEEEALQVARDVQVAGEQYSSLYDGNLCNIPFVS